MTVTLSAEAATRVRSALDTADTSALSSPAELHAYAHMANYGSPAHGAALLRVVTDPRCDRGTAQRVYWLAEPLEYFFEHTTADTAVSPYGPGARAMFALFDAIEARFARDDFASASITYDPHCDPAADADLTDGWDNPDAARAVPPALVEPTPGDVHDEMLPD
jgi:hypothetical protein